jgi:phage repressor protein C with HTH and peptisase S24 domain
MFGKYKGIMAARLLIFGKKLAALRIERYLTQEELASRLGMSTAGVRRLEQLDLGGMHMRNFRRLAELTKLTPPQLRRRIGTPIGEPNRSQAPGNDQPTALAGDSLVRVVDVERFHGVSAARLEDRAGVKEGRVPVPAGTRRRFAAVVDGDCMEPKYHHGDVVVFSIDAAEREGIVDGRNYFVQFADGENTFKRVFCDPENSDRLVLRCWNPKYPARAVERSRVQILARAEFRLVPDENMGADLNLAAGLPA